MKEFEFFGSNNASNLLAEDIIGDYIIQRQLSVWSVTGKSKYHLSLQHFRYLVNILISKYLESKFPKQYKDDKIKKLSILEKQALYIKFCKLS